MFGGTDSRPWGELEEVLPFNSSLAGVASDVLFKALQLGEGVSGA